MKIYNWADPQEIKELMCGNKMVVSACHEMGTCTDFCSLVMVQ